MFRISFRALVIPVAAGAVALAVATPASASAAPDTSSVATPNSAARLTHDSSDTYGATGRCGNSLCLYFNSYEAGAVAGFNANVADFAGYNWPRNGNGGGGPIKNNAASAENQGPDLDIVYYNSNYGGNFDYLYPGSYGQLYYTYNNNASAAV